MASISPKTAASPSTGESSPTVRRWKYHVYLSSSDYGSGRNFTSHLYDGLRNKGVKTFKDDPDTSGDDHHPTLKATIEDSWFAVVVLSRNYAHSTRSLDELAMICECMNNNNRIIPVFYQVEPTDVKYQKGSFEEAFTKYENSGRFGSVKLNQWRDALRLVGALPLSEWQYKQGFKLSVQRIIGSVLRHLPYLPKINTVNNHIISNPTREATIDIEPMISREPAASLPSSAEPSLKARQWKYDVFFSFQGDSFVNNIIYHARSHLQRSGFKTYIDDRMSTGCCIDPITTLPAIEESRFAVIILSQTYAHSGCCLEELAKICECMKDQNRILTVFHDVDPNDVKYQTGSFEQALNGHQNSRQCVSLEKVYQWRDALRNVGSFSGFSPPNYGWVPFFYGEALAQAVCSKLQPVVEINIGDLELSEATRQATVELEASMSESNDNVEVVKVIRRATNEVEPIMTKSTEDFEAVEATPRVIHGNCPATRQAPEPSVSESNENVEVSEVIRQATIEIEPTMPKSTEDIEAVGATPRATDGNCPATRLATVELEPSMLESNEIVEVAKVLRDATIDIKPTMPKSTKDFEAVEATVRTTNGNCPGELSPQWKHDVFLSFRGEDTRKGFLSHLYHELQNTKVIRIFKDDNQLEKGKDISQTLLTAIEESRFAIIVLSENYAFSSWCLDELTKIFQCMEGKDTILPIFYHVDPSDVRYQKNSYEVAFTKHESKARYAIEKVNQWRADLTKVGNLSGWDSKNHKSERELVEDIVTFVLKKVRQAPPGDFEELEATRKAMDVVKKMLNDDKFTAIGVFGRGGVGKTAMVKHVSAEAQRTGIVDQVVMAVISRNPDLQKIQGALVNQLGVELVGDEEIYRASRLKERIMGGKKILIILDDIWEEINLSSIGIPNYDELQKCNSKVLLTTRVRNLCESMGCQSHIPLTALSEEDSLKLLMKKLGKPFHESTVSDEERNVVRECAGLPNLLEEAARALGHKYIEEWNEALTKAFGDNDNELQIPAEKLNASQLVHTKDERDTFRRIKLSYNALRFDDAKSFFLLCCMFPEDYDIPIEELFKYGIGKGLFQSSDMLQEARAGAHSLVAYLKASGLLLDGKKGCIRMHCDIRKVAMSIALSEGQAFFVKAGCGLKDWPMDAREGYSAISLMRNKINKLSETLVCSKLEILLLQCNASICDIPETCFQSPNALRVVDLSYTGVSVLPSSLNLLTNLQALYLDCCYRLTDISVLGKLKKVEILSLRKFPQKELPKEIGNLTSLRMLDITGACVHKIAPKVLSRLYRLEELYMKCEFGNWGSKVEEAVVGQTNANFDEMIGLSHLSILKVCISDAACLPKDIGQFVPNWVKFDICISRDLSSEMMLSPNDQHSTTLTLDRTINGLSDWFINLVTERTKKLEYRECKGVINILKDHEHGRLRGLKRLNVVGCHENLEELINATTWDPSKPVFESLEELHLLHLQCLKELCIGELPLGSLCNLKLLKVQTCCSLVNALLPPKLLQRLTNLETIYCVNMVHMKFVFGSEGIELVTIVLRKLSEMRLCALFELISIWNGPAPPAVFGNLKVLAVCMCTKLESLFPFDVARSLKQLEDLSVERCPNMVRVIEASNSLNVYICFPELKKLALINLPELTCFCTENGSIDIECPLLEYLYVDKCPQFTNTASASASVKFSDQQHLNSLAKRWEDMYKL